MQLTETVDVVDILKPMYNFKVAEKEAEVEHMPVMVIMMGLQGSGKSTFCVTQYSRYTRINLDTLCTRKKEQAALWQALNRRENVIIDNTNPTTDDRKKYIAAGMENRYKLVGCFMQSKLEDCIERNNTRTGKEKIPPIALKCTYDKLELPCYEEGFDELYFVEILDGGYIVSDWRKGMWEI